MANTNYTGLPDLPGVERSEAGADAQGNLVPENTQPNPAPRPAGGLFKSRPVKEELAPVAPEPKKKRFKGPSIGCRTISMLFSLAIIAIIVFIIYVLIYRPPGIWNPVKAWLNEDLQAVEFKKSDQDVVLSDLLAQTQSFKVGTNKLNISETATNILVNRELDENSQIFLDVEPGTLKVFADVERENAEDLESLPFWVVADFSVDPENKAGLIIDGVGTERAKTPAFLNDFILDLILSTGNALTRSNATSILELIVILPDNAKISAIELEKDNIVLSIELTSGLENIFQP